MTSPRETDRHTLALLAAGVVLVLVLLAVADWLRGTGGPSWWHGTESTAASRVPTSSPGEAAGEHPESGATLFRAVRVFDGERVLPSTNVLVRDGRVAAVGPDVDADDAVVVRAPGATLLPGLIDAHVHVFGPVLEAALMLGVTTELDMFTSPEAAAQWRAQQQRGEANGRADVFSAGYLVTAPGGHGTEYGMQIPTLESPEQADAFVQARVEEGSDYIKIVVDPGSLNRSFQTLDRATVRAVIEAAHRRGKLAVVHVARLEDARAVIADGADGIMHVFSDVVADDGIIELMRERGAFVVPTLSVLESVTGLPGGAELARDPRLSPYLGPAELSSLKARFPPGPGREDLLDNGIESVRRLHRAGVRILAGTDSPNPGTAHGASLHRELELLVRAGLTPQEALSAATARTSDAFGLEDRGRIAPGLRADLLLVRADPTRDITASRDILGVWKNGVRADREAYRRHLEEASQPVAIPGEVAGGAVASFEGGQLDASFGAGWNASTDSIVGGRSRVELNLVSPGAEGSAGALEVVGTLVPGAMATWAGAMLSPGMQPFAPADLSAYKGFSFWTRGDGGRHVVMLFARSNGQIPAMQTFVAPEQWTQVRFSFREFAGIDPKGLQAILWSGGGAGEFRFQIDEVRLH